MTPPAPRTTASTSGDGSTTAPAGGSGTAGDADADADDRPRPGGTAGAARTGGAAGDGRHDGGGVATDPDGRLPDGQLPDGQVDEGAAESRPRVAGRLPYNPALDGIRGLAVGAVLLFHGGFEWARGGFLGVSTFFTLSGFLITSLVVGEHAGRGRIRVTAFWARRLRRLLPASAVTLLGVEASAWVLSGGWERALRGDVIGSALHVANWHFLFQDQAYANLFGPDESPVLHFWSLAIEEQFYWVFPLLAAGVLGLARGSLRVFGGVLAVLLGVSAALTMAYGDSPDTVYYSTPIRMGEILAGALLAVVVARGRLVGARRLAPLIGLGGAAALAVSLWSWWNLERETTALYEGGLLVYAGVSVLLVLAACLPGGPIRWLLAFEPLRLLGVISYGVYLFHWPIFRVLDEARVDRIFEPLDLQPRGAALFALRLAPTLVVAVASYHLLERPIRTGQWPRWRLRTHAPLLAAGTVGAVVLVAAITPRLSPPPQDPFEEALDRMENAQGAIAERIEATPDWVPRALFFGDSSALMISVGVGTWGLDTQQVVSPGAVTVLGCGIGRGGERRQNGEVVDMPGRRCDWERTWPAEIGEHPETQLAVVLTGSWDVVDRRIPGDDRWRGPGDPVYDRFLREELEGATDLLRSRGLTVVWLTTPPLDFNRSNPEAPEDDPPDVRARIDRLNQLVGEVAGAREGVAVVDLGAWFAALPPAEDARLRPDGVHVTLDTTVEVARWLGPEILAAARSVGFVPPQPPPG